MAKFSGNIGYAETSESKPGVYTEVITERHYVGDILRIQRRLSEGENLNDDVVVNNLFSIVSDPFAIQNMYAMRYITWMGASWKIRSIDASQRPRLLLTIGGVYNGPKARTTG